MPSPGGTSDPAVVSAARNKRTRPSFSSTDQTQVEIIIEQGRKHFTMHRELLCFYSEYFRRAFQGSFRETETKSITLADVGEPIFRIFQAWLFSQASRKADTTVLYTSHTWVTSHTRDTSYTRDYLHPRFRYYLQACSDLSILYPTKRARDCKDKYVFNVYLELYAFADQYDILQLRRDILTIAIVTEDPIETEPATLIRNLDVEYMCSLLPETAGLRKYLTNRIMYTWIKDRPGKAELERFPEDIRMEVLYQALVLTQTNLTDARETHLHDACFYHEHSGEDESEQYRCQYGLKNDLTFYGSFFEKCTTEVLRRFDAELDSSETM